MGSAEGVIRQGYRNHLTLGPLFGGEHPSLLECSEAAFANFRIHKFYGIRLTDAAARCRLTLRALLAR